MGAVLALDKAEYILLVQPYYTIPTPRGRISALCEDRLQQQGFHSCDFGGMPVFGPPVSCPISINQSINTFITRHGTEARATVRIMPKQREMS